MPADDPAGQHAIDCEGSGLEAVLVFSPVQPVLHQHRSDLQQVHTSTSTQVAPAARMMGILI